MTNYGRLLAPDRLMNPTTVKGSGIFKAELSLIMEADFADFLREDVADDQYKFELVFWQQMTFQMSNPKRFV